MLSTYSSFTSAVAVTGVLFSSPLISTVYVPAVNFPFASREYVFLSSDFASTSTVADPFFTVIVAFSGNSASKTKVKVSAFVASKLVILGNTTGAAVGSVLGSALGSALGAVVGASVAVSLTVTATVAL